MFVQHFYDNIDGNQCNEIFMLLNKKLANLLLSPQKNKDQDEFEDEFDDTMGNGLMGGGRGASR